MDKAEIMTRIHKVKNKQSDFESFIKPPEEFGNAVKLYLNDNHTFRAVVFDPDTRMEYHEQNLAHEQQVCSFIIETLSGKNNAHKLDHETDEVEYINIYWDEWKD